MEYAIVDIETTGSYASENSITEIAILIHNGKHILEKFQTLINPLKPIPFHIQALTGISQDMVADAPVFKEVAPRIFDLLNKRVFVAHNVNFDYSFLVHQLKFAGYEWKAAKLCTVRLSRKIFPNLASYSLGKLCMNLGIPLYDRHRAMGDAEATTILFEKLVQEDTTDLIATTLKKTKEHRLPTHINEEDFLRLPESAGVYLFRNKSDKIIYVGKAINIKKRVLSHFSGNNTSLKRQSFINEICSIDFEESGTELMALLMECQLIKQHWPIHNRALKKFEPKFALIQYEDQAGYIRLLVSPYNKSAHAIQYFERAYEANQLLLKLMDDFDLDQRLCFFYSITGEQKPKASKNGLASSEEHNTRVWEALTFVENQRTSFFLLDQGRHLDEKSYIFFKNDQLYAFGFFDNGNQFNSLSDMVSDKDRCTTNYYMNSLVLQYAERFPSKIKLLSPK